MSEVYYHKKRYVKRIQSLYQCMDFSENGSISLTEFFDLIDIIEKKTEYGIPLFPDS